MYFFGFLLRNALAKLMVSILLSQVRRDILLGIDIPDSFVFGRNVLSPSLPFLVVDKLLLCYGWLGLATTFILNLGQIL